MYEDVRQMFTGIQVAGPRLTRKTMDEGFHAIPPHPSSSPGVPACYYEPGDYTCVKDAASGHYNTTKPPTVGYAVGCWQMNYLGRRSVLGGWPKSNINVGSDPNDPCR